MNRNYLNEFVDLLLYGDCLSESDYKNYSVFLKKNLLTEMTAEGFADILKRVFLTSVFWTLIKPQ